MLRDSEADPYRQARRKAGSLARTVTSDVAPGVAHLRPGDVRPEWCRPAQLDIASDAVPVGDPGPRYTVAGPNPCC